MTMTAHDELKLQLLQRPGVANHLLHRDLLQQVVDEYAATSAQRDRLWGMLRSIYDDNGVYRGSWEILRKALWK